MERESDIADFWGSAGAARAGFGASPKRTLALNTPGQQSPEPEKIRDGKGAARQHARRVRYPETSAAASARVRLWCERPVPPPEYRERKRLNMESQQGALRGPSAAAGPAESRPKLGHPPEFSAERMRSLGFAPAMRVSNFLLRPGSRIADAEPR